MEESENGMHEIKNKRRPRAVKNKKESLHLHAKKRMSRASKAVIALCSVLIFALGAYSVGSAFFKAAQRNTVDLNYGSPSVPVAEGEVYSLAGGYDPVDIFARLNWKFSHQSLWYAEMHGTVDTVIQQSITTFKQYENGILISADLTESSLIKSASQFCYLKEKDRVIWRKPASKDYEGLNTEWQTGEPYNIMTIGGEHGFKATNGLPAYELSVYVIAEDTVASTSPVTVTEDGKFKITYDLKPETWQEEVDGVLTTKGATAYYINQMIFTGGLTTPPEFNALSVTFTFDENWQVFQTDIEEKYSAKYGPIAAPCVSTSTTAYEYNTEKAHSDAYEEYFCRYAEGEVNNGPIEKEITALDCLAEGFGSVLTDPTVLDLDLTVGDTSYRGTVDLDLSQADFAAFDLSKIDAKLKLGPLSLWVEQGDAYLNYGGLKFALKSDELISLVEELTAETEPDAQTEEEDLLSALAGGEFTLTDGKAELRSVLPLLGLDISVDFSFTVGEDRAISAEKVTAIIPLGDGRSIAAQIGFGKEHLPALNASEKAEYVPLMPYVNELIELFSADVLHADVSYRSEGIAVSGGFDLRLDELALAGEIQADVSANGIELSKKAGLSFAHGMLYLDLDGVKVQASLEEGIALLGQYVALPELPETGALSELDFGMLINTLLSEDFAALFSSSEENGLLLAVKGSELLSAFGVDFALGNVTVTAEKGKLSAAAFGAEIVLTQGTEVALDTQGYTSILPYVQTLINLFSQEELALSLSFAAGDFTAEGEIMLSLSSQKAAGEIVLGYGNAKKTLSVIYGEDSVYLSVEGVRVKANVKEAAALVSSLTGAENDFDAKTLINKVLALDFGSVIALGEENDSLTALLKGTELLHALGVEFELGDVALTVDGESVNAKAEDLGVEITVKAGKPFETDTSDYIEIVAYAETIATMIESGYLAADVSYTSGKLTITGTIELALDTLNVQGTLTLKYGKAEQQIKVIYGENVVYLELGGMKISADVNEAVKLIGRYIDLPEVNTEERDLIEDLLSMDFKQVFTLSKEGDDLSLAIAGTELLHALGVEFELGNVALTVDHESVNAKAKDLGVEITITQGKPFETDTSGYIEIVQYAETIATMIESGYLAADVSYTSGKLMVTGTIELALDTLEVQGTLTLKYGKAEQKLHVIYGTGVVYLELGGMKVSADVNEAVKLIGRYIDLPEVNTEERDLLEDLLSLDFAKVFTLSKEGDDLSLAIAGTELLHALGVEFELGKVALTVDHESVNAKAEDLGVEITVKAGKAFNIDTNGYIEIVQYAETIATMIESGYLAADVSYTSGKLTVTGTIELALDTFEVQGTLTLKYGKAEQKLHIIYGTGVVYLELGGMKVSADVNEAVKLIGRYIDLPEVNTEERDLLEDLLSMDFAQVFTLSKEGDDLSLAIAGMELLHALGVEFELGNVALTVDGESVNAKAEDLGVEITVKAGKPFATDTNGYIEIVQYAETIATMIESGYLAADVSYTSGKLTITGTIELALDTLNVQGTLTLKYGKAEQKLHIIYGTGVVYLELGGMKVSADVNEAVKLIGRYIDLPEVNTEERDLLEDLLSMDFAQVFTLSKEGDDLSLAIAGTELLHALGVEFELGNVALTVDGESVNAKAEDLGVEITVKAGKPFETDTSGYIEIVQYAETIATMIESGYLAADVSYTSGKLTVTGTIDLALDTLAVQGTLTLKYGKGEQKLHVIYGDNVVYLELGGMKVSADVNEAVALIGRYIDLPEVNTEERDLLEDLLSLDFAKVFTLSKEGDDLSLVIAGTELLHALGVEFELGKVALTVDGESVNAKAEDLGVEITITQGKPFNIDTNGYIEIVQYAEMIATMIESGYLAADVSYTSGKLTVTGTIELALDTFEVQVTLTLKYGKAEQKLHVIYGDNVVYLELGGMKVSADVNEAVALIGRYIDLPEVNTKERDLLEDLLSLDFAKVFTLTKEGDDLSLAIAGTELLHALGVEFELGDVALTIDNESVNAKAEDLGVEITVKAGKPFTTDTSGYIEIVQYAETIATMIESGYLAADVSYTSGKLTITGIIELALDTLNVQGALTLKYGKAEQQIKVIYGENVVYLELGGMKISADVNEAVALIGRYIDLPEVNTEERDLLEDLLSMNFAKVFTLSKEGDDLSLAIAGTELLHALGVEFELGDVALTVDGESVNAKAEDLGVEITVKAGKPFTTDTSGYIEIVQYAETIATMIESGYLAADVSYTSGKLTITGKIELALDTFEVQGTLTLRYGKAEQQIKVIYGENVVYLELGGMKISADVNEAVALIGRYIDLPEVNTEERDLLEDLLSLDFAKVFTLTKEGDDLSLAIAGTELLHALGVEFELGDVALTVDSESVNAKAEDIGVGITVKAGKAFETDTNGYIEIVAYAETIATMIEGGYLAADVSYTSGKLTVTGTIELALDTFEVQGTLTLKYGEETLKQIGIAYAGDSLYLTVYGADPEESLKVSLGTREAVALVASLVGASGDTDAETLLEKLLCLDLKELIPVFEEAQSGDVLKLTVAGNRLFSVFGVEFGLGDVQLELAKAGTITAKVAGAEITVKSGVGFSVDTVGYLDLTPLLQNVKTILTDKALALCGGVVITVNDLVIDVEIENAVLSFENGIRFYLHTFISLQNKAELEVFLSYEDGTVRFACGALGAEIVLKDVGSLKEALLDVYGDLHAIVENMLVDKSRNPLPAPDDFRDLLGRTAGDDELSAPVWTEIVKAVVFRTTQTDISAAYGGLIARLFFPSDLGFLGAELSGSFKDLSVQLDGTLHLKHATYSGTDETGKNLVEFPEMPKINYLGTKEFKAIIGYFGSAVDLLNATDLTLTFNGKVTSADTVTYPPAEGEEFGTKYRIEASMSTHRGKSNLVHLDVGGKNLWVDTDVFAHASINITAANEADNSLYIDLFILDGVPVTDEEGNVTYEKDNMLDFYVTLSQFGPVGTTADAVAGYEPVRLYAPSDEILTLLSSALPILGVDAEILNNYMIEKWLSLENVEQLKAFGGMVAPLLSGLLGTTPANPTEPADPAEPATPAEPLLIKDYLKGLTVTEEELSLELNSEKLYGIEGLRDVAATLVKEADPQDGSGSRYGKFVRLDLLNIYDKTGMLNTSLKGTISYDEVTPDVPSGTYDSFLGAEKLLLAIAKSATHPAEGSDEIISGEDAAHRYQLNSNFYLDGKIEANLLGLVDVTIDLVAISVNVDENGELGINLRLKYDGKALLLVAINGNSTVDITIKGGMVYMKRVQTTKQTTFRNSPIDPITLYRAMPLQNFTGDMLGQLGFILNFGEMINNAIKNGSAGGGDEGSTTPASEKMDFGTTLRSVLKVYTFAEEGNTQTWHLEINGSSFSNGILGDVVVDMKATDGLFKEFNVTKLKINIPAGAIKLGLTASLNLTWHNAGGISDGAEEQTDPTLYETLSDKEHGFGGMVEKLNTEHGWTETAEDGSVTYKFLEGQETTVSYKYRSYAGDETADLGTQQVMTSTGNDSFAQNTLYSVLGYPALTEHPDTPEFAVRWDEVRAGGTLPNDFTVYARQQKQLYLVTFRSDEDLGDEWDYDEAEGMYYIKRDMEYGATVDLGGETFTVTDQNTIFDVTKEKVPPFERGERAGKWQKNPEIGLQRATFIPEYEPDTIVYVSEIAFTVADHTVGKMPVEGFEETAYAYSVEYGTTYTVETAPVADGYTFLGWYAERDGVWSEVKGTLELASEKTVVIAQALWATATSDAFAATLETALEVGQSGSLFGGKYDSSWKYHSTLRIEGDCLVGAMAADKVLQRTVSVEHYLANENESNKLNVTNAATVSQEDEMTVYQWEQTWKRSTSLGTNYKRTQSYAVITFTYRLEGLADITFEVKATASI